MLSSLEFLLQQITGESYEEEYGNLFYEYSETLPVYENNSMGRLKDGVSIRFDGYIQTFCERFSIDFIIENQTRDVALHINPRLPQNYIVRNTKVNNTWGSEEVSSALPFSLQRGNRFTIEVLVTNDCYMICVNGFHFAKYYHRLPFKAVSALEVRGDVQDITMKRTLATFYPESRPASHEIPLSRPQIPSESSATNAMDTAKDDSPHDSNKDEVDAKTKNIPKEWRTVTMKLNNVLRTARLGEKLPYYGKLPIAAWTVGRYIRIEARVKLLPHSFYINIQKSDHIWPHPIIGFHFNPRFSNTGPIGKAIVVRNAWLNGAWANEERSELETNFRPGKTFVLCISCCEDEYKVYVDQKFMCSFKHRVKPELLDTVYIQGDIKLWSITLEDGQDGLNYSVAPNVIQNEDF